MSTTVFRSIVKKHFFHFIYLLKGRGQLEKNTKQKKESSSIEFDFSNVIHKIEATNSVDEGWLTGHMENVRTEWMKSGLARQEKVEFRSNWTYKLIKSSWWKVWWETLFEKPFSIRFDLMNENAIRSNQSLNFDRVDSMRVRSADYGAVVCVCVSKQ